MNKVLINYNDLYYMYKIELLNLKILEEKKEQIRSKYFKITTSYGQTQNSGNYDNKYESYMIELDQKNIEKNIQDQKNVVSKLNYYLKKIEYFLSNLSGIEYRLFYKVINGLNISKAVEEIVSENMENNSKIQDATIIWKKYYPNIKNEIKQFEDMKK